MRYVEDDMQCRVRVGKKNEDRVTGNMIAMRLTHRDTRINEDDLMPDMSLHDHVVIFNATYDSVERKWKATQMGEIKHDAPYYEAIYHNRLASNLRELGYGIRRKDKSFEVEGVSDELVKQFSRRRATINKVAEELGLTSPAARDKLGATTRLGKAAEITDDLNDYWRGRLSDPQRESLTRLIGKPSYESNETQAVRFAVGHLFERQSVVDDRRLYEAAIRHGIGSVTPEAVTEEARRQGVLVKDGQATTRDVLAEESCIIEFARVGKGTMRPLDPTLSKLSDGSWFAQYAALSKEQKSLVSHVLKSTDQMVLVIGDAGTGKTHAIKTMFNAIERPIEMLAPSVDASRGVLRADGFAKADTVASFLLSEKRQAGVKNGVIWVDEAGLLPIKDLSRLVEVAKMQDARIVLQGDPKQHKSVVRHGNMMNVLEEYAGLHVGRLTETWRQKLHQGYKAIVETIAQGNRKDALDKLVELGWVRQVDGNEALVDEYMEALRTKKAVQPLQDRVLIIAPTHIEGEEITHEIRNRLKQGGELGDEERRFPRLVALNWTEAERGDLERYDGSEVMQFHRNSGTFQAGDRVKISQWERGDRFRSPSHFSVYGQAEISLAAGDLIRFTANGKTLDGHKINNGSTYRIKKIDEGGNLILDNGWKVGKDFCHLSHGYCSTSHAAQGKTVDCVLIAMGSESRGAIGAEQFYVSVSRGRESARVFTDMTADELKQAIQRSDQRKSATELMSTKTETKRTPTRLDQLMKFVKKARERLKDLQAEFISKPKEHSYEKERHHAGHER